MRGRRYADTLVTVREAMSLLEVDERTMQGLISAQILVRVRYRRPDLLQFPVDFVTVSSMQRILEAAAIARRAYEA